MTKQNKLVTGLIASALIGAVAGLLFAPRPGKATRNTVATRASELRHKAGGYVDALRRRDKGEGSYRSPAESANGHSVTSH